MISNIFITFVAEILLKACRSLKVFLKLGKENSMHVSELIDLLKEDGWLLTRTKGSHRQYKHPGKKGIVTISGKLSDDVRKGTLGSVLRQAGLK